MGPANHQELANFIWSVADLLRGTYEASQYERVMLPLTVLRRLDCMLSSSIDPLVQHYKPTRHTQAEKTDHRRNSRSSEALGFHNNSDLSFSRLVSEPDKIGSLLRDYISGFSANVRKIFECFEFENEIAKLEKENRLYLIICKFAEIDLSPSRVDHYSMGFLYAELIRRFNEAANDSSSEYFTPRDAIRLILSVLFHSDSNILAHDGVIRTLYDPVCGTGGMLFEAQNWLREYNPDGRLIVYGQEINRHAYAIAAADLLLKGDRDSLIELDDTLVADRFPRQSFDYLLAHPPFSFGWKRQQAQIIEEHKHLGHSGRFGPGLPRVSDGSLLFLLHMLSKFHLISNENGLRGTRMGIILNSSPLTTGGANSGESEIRRWIIENDWLEAIIALPDQMFYNTSIGTFIWILTNRKTESRRGKVQMLDARGKWTSMRHSLGHKRRYLSDDAIGAITHEYAKFSESETCRILDNAYLGHRRIVVERPLRLRFQISSFAKEQFLDLSPEFLDAVQLMERELGNESWDDWNEAWKAVQRVVKETGVKWTAASRKLFREVFTVVDPHAKPVIARSKSLSPEVGDSQLTDPPLSIIRHDLDALFGVYWNAAEKHDKGSVVEYEPNPALRTSENVPLIENICSFFLREVRPFAQDAWIDHRLLDPRDGSVGIVGYAIPFNRLFFSQMAYRPLEVIDSDLLAVEKNVLRLLRSATESSGTATRVLNPDVPMQATGLDWMPHIPAHWEMRRLKWLVQTPPQDNLSKTSNFIAVGDNVGVLKLSAVAHGTFIASENKELDTTENYSSELTLKSGDVLITKSNTPELVGDACVVPFDFPNLVCSDSIFRLRFNHEIIHPEYLVAFLISSAARDQMRRDLSGSSGSIAHISQGQILDWRVPVPPLREQIVIVDHLRTERVRASEAEANLLRSIELLKERRDAMVTAAVTGQIETKETVP